MNRRGFLSFFGKASAAGALAGAATIAHVEAGPETFEYRGFTAEWTGWKQSHDSGYSVGQWLAKKEGEPFGVYSSFPGGEGQYLDFYAFDTAVRGNQYMIGAQTSERDKAIAKEDARKRLIMRIDQAMAPAFEDRRPLGEGRLVAKIGYTSSAGCLLEGKW